MDSWSDFRTEIDHRLDTVRPARCGADEKDWREEVYGWARNHIPDETHLVRHYAKEIVDRREALATKRANIVLRKWAHGQTPLDWCLAGPLPIKANGVRIRLDAATPDDIEDAARELEAAGKATFDEVMLLAACMRDLARGARRSNLPTVVLLGNLGPRHDHDGIITPDDLDDDSPF
ncbi:MAG: hypothetical protein QOJ23_3071 [Actinomycetota bacterium]|jgi:hypothetical protein|nr:hypothetical protein [Actinomycetota bacterium]